MFDGAVREVGREVLDVEKPSLGISSEKARAFIELTKPRITFEVALISTFGFFLGKSGATDWALLVHTIIAVSLLSSGIGVLNQYIEADVDRLMKRTANRPLPTGKVTRGQALVFGILLTVVAEVYLFFAANPVTALLGLMTAVGYVVFYTPLKTKSTVSTFIGSFPGAMPPIVGWTAAGGALGWEAAALFALMFFWQYPHFLAIAWMYREDYSRASIKMLPVVEPDGRRTKRQILLNTLVLLPLSLTPTLFGLTGFLYLAASVLLGAYFLNSVVRLYRSGTGVDARKVLKSSIVYITVLFLMMVVDKV